MGKKPNFATVSCKRCGKKIATLLPVVSDKQCICEDCCTTEEKYQILDEQAKQKGFTRKE